jgi:heme exporter protein D
MLSLGIGPAMEARFLGRPNGRGPGYGPASITSDAASNTARVRRPGVAARRYARAWTAYPVPRVQKAIPAITHYNVGRQFRAKLWRRGRRASKGEQASPRTGECTAWRRSLRGRRQIAEANRDRPRTWMRALSPPDCRPGLGDAMTRRRNQRHVNISTGRDGPRSLAIASGMIFGAAGCLALGASIALVSLLLSTVSIVLVALLLRSERRRNAALASLLEQVAREIRVARSRQDL